MKVAILMRPARLSASSRRIRCRPQRHPHRDARNVRQVTQGEEEVPISKQIQIKRGCTKLSHPDFLLFLRTVCQSLLNNAHFPKPIVDMTLFQAKIEEYAAAIIAT